MQGGRGWSRTLWKCGADLLTDWSVCGAIVRTCGSTYLDKRGYLLTYLLISLKRSCGLYESTEQELPINQSLYHYVLHILRTCRSVHRSAGLYVRLAGLSMTTQLAYSFTDLCGCTYTVCLDWNSRKQYTWSENVVNLANRNTWQLHINC